MLLDPQSFDLVQHIETVLDAVEGDELADRINAELMQSVPRSRRRSAGPRGT